MRAIALSAPGGCENFRLVDVPAPVLRPGDVRIRVRAVSFNPIDHQLRRSGTADPAQPWILGRDVSGVVDTVHPDVDAFSPGDEVYSYITTRASSGAYAEYVAVPAELVALKPRALTHEQAAAVPVAAITAQMALEKLGVGPESSLFMAGGAGGVGSFALALARLRGVRRLMTTAGREASRSYLIQDCGVDAADILDYRDPDFVEQARACNGGNFDTALDLVGGKMLSACCELVGTDGHVASVTEGPGPDDVERLFASNASFHAIGANAYSLVDERRAWLRYRAMLHFLADHFDRGALGLPHVAVVGGFSVDSVRSAHEQLERSGVHGKLVMSLA